jgi:autotransporter-associated beta strand protein
LAFLFAGSLELRAQFVSDTWTGGGPGTNWSTANNWSNGVPPSGNTTSVFFGLAAGPYTSTVDSNYTVSVLQVDLGSSNFTLNSAGGSVLTINSTFWDYSTNLVTLNIGIAGSANFTVVGGGIVLVNTANNAGFTGVYMITSGTLIDEVAGAFSPNGIMEIGNAGVVEVGYNETIAALTDGPGGHGVVSTFFGTTLFMTGPYSTTFTGVITGSGGIEKDNVGTLGLSGANTYTGTTVIGAGGAISIGFIGQETGSLASPSVSGAGSLAFILAGNYTYPGTLFGALNVVQQGPNITTLSGTNTYSGPTFITGGTLQAGSASAFGGATGLSPVTIGAGTILDLNNFDNTVGSISGAGSVTLGSATLTIGDPFSVKFFSGDISGTGSLNMGGNTLTLSGNLNTYSGGTTISNGTLVAENSAGSATGSGPITILPAGTLLLGQRDTNGSVDPAAVITDNGLVDFFRSDNFTFANNISGTGGIGQYGAGTVTVSGTNTYSGPTTAFTGTLQAGSASAFGGATGLSAVGFGFNGTLDLNGFNNTVGSISGGGSGGTILLTGASLTTGGDNSTSTFSGVISGTGGLAIVGTGMTILDGVNNYAGGTNIVPGATLSVGDGATVGAVIAGNVQNNGLLEFAPAMTDSITFPGIISGIGAVNIGGLGSINLTGLNSYSGGTTVTRELFVGSSTNGPPGSFTLGPVGTGTLTFMTGSELSPSANVTLANAISLNTDGTYVDNDDGGANGLTLTGLISGIGGIAWCTTGTFELIGANTFSGGVDMRSGTLLLGSSTNGPPISFTTGPIGIGGLVLDTGSIVAAGIPVVALANNIDLTGNTQIGNGVGDSSALDFSGQISGAGNITYAAGSAGSLTLDGANTFYGTTTINGGTVFAANNLAFGAGNTVTLQAVGGQTANLSVNSGVTINNTITTAGSGNVISGSGTIGSAVTIDGTVTLSPGNPLGSPLGTLTFNNGLTLATNGSMSFNLLDANGAPGTGFGTFSVTGGVLNMSANAGSLAFNVNSINAGGGPALALNFSSSNGYSWMFGSSSSAIAGFLPNGAQFNILSGGFLNATNGGTFSISENAMNQLFLNFTPVPEPSTWALLGLGVLTVVPFALRRRRRA